MPNESGSSVSVLAPPAADALHPAFSNLFVQTEIVPQRQAILCTRRPRSQGEPAPCLLHLMAATLCLSWFTDLDYMFSAQATVNGMVRPSDSAVIAQALWLPYWFWGGVVACFSLAVAALGIAFVSRDVGQQR